MRIKYLGHASFVITTDAGTRVLTDPFDATEYPDKLLFDKIEEAVDVVTVSHGHRDHAGNLADLPGAPVIIRGNGKFVAEGVDFLGVETFHDSVRGGQRGGNTVYVMTADGLRVAHMGDLGHVLTSDQAAEIGAVDVVLVPVGGYYTVDAEEAARVVEQIDARIIIPMHYRNEKCLFPIAPVDDFIAGKDNVVRAERPELEISTDSLPAETQIVVLETAL